MWRSLLNTRFKEVAMNANFSSFAKEKLNRSISSVEKKKESFVTNPGIDFTRKRKLPFDEIIRILLSIGGNSLGKEMLDYFNFSNNMPSRSAFIQQRSKILPSALESIQREFLESFNTWKKHKGYRVFAFDGSRLQIARNSSDEETHLPSYGVKGANFLHLNVMYDLVNKVYVDSVTQSVRTHNEYVALIEMMLRSNLDDPVLFIADRGYENYNIIAHAEKKGWKYLIRIKEPDSKNGISSKLALPTSQEFNQEYILKMTRRQTKEIREQPNVYRFLSSSSKFDFLKQGDKGFYTLNFRIVCVRLEADKYQYFVTNLTSDEFSYDDIRELYKMRWGVETSFRELKHTLALNSFHGTKVEFCQQEIYARMIMYNFCELITLQVVVTKKNRKHAYQVNFTMAIHICKRFFRTPAGTDPPEVETLISKHILPVREGRIYGCNVKFRSFVSFIYRVA